MDIDDKFFRINKCSYGFTLVELIITLLLASLITILVLPNLSNTIKEIRFKNEVNALINQLRKTKMIAIQEHHETEIYFNIKERNYYSSIKSKKNYFSSGIDIKLETLQQSSDYSNAPLIKFFPDGTSTGGKIDIINNNNRYVIRINWITGRISHEG